MKGPRLTTDRPCVLAGAPMADFYSVLGLTRSASRGEIKAAFRKAAVQHHPDKWAPGLNPAFYVLDSKR